MSDTSKLKNFKLTKTKALYGAVVLFLFVIGWVVFGQVYSFTKSVQKNWTEIKFAYEKPELVKYIRQQYEQKTASAEADLMKTQPSEQDKLLQTLTQKLQDSKSK